MTPTRPKRAAKKGKRIGVLSKMAEAQVRIIVREELATRAGTVPSEPTEAEVKELARVMHEAWMEEKVSNDYSAVMARAAYAHPRSKP